MTRRVRASFRREGSALFKMGRRVRFRAVRDWSRADYAANGATTASRDAIQFHGSSECSPFALVRPETMRSRTSVNQVIGSTPFSFAVWINVMAIDQWRAPPSLPANRAFLRSKVCGRMLRSTVFELDASVIEERDQARPVAHGVAHCLRQVRGTRHPADMCAQPVIQRLDDWSAALLTDAVSVLGWMAADLGLDRI